jgi:hypothetical protein
MSLDTRPAYPHPLCYVLKLHRDSRPGNGSLQGVLEHVASGDVIPFQSTAALQAALVTHASPVHARVVAADAPLED